jgi:hypothetical protein
VADEAGTVEKGRKQLATCDTIEEAKASVDRCFEWQAGYPQREASRKEEVEKLQREREERERIAREEKERIHQGVLACIQPIRDFVAVNGITMLRQCIECLDQEDRDRNVPANWQELADRCERIGEYLTEHDWCDNIGQVDVDKYGVTVHSNYDNRHTYDYLTHREYGLEDFIDEYNHLFEDGYIVDDEEEDAEIDAKSDR